MQRIIHLLTCLLIVSPIIQLHAGNAGSITHVDLYRDAGFITRTTELTVEAGSQTITLDHFPRSIDTSFLEISLSDSTTVRLEDAQFEQRSPNTPIPELESIHSKIETLQLQIKTLESDMDIKESEAEFHEEIAQSYAENFGKANSELNQSKIDQIASYLNQSLHKLRDEKFAILEKITKIKKEIEELETHYDELSETFSKLPNKLVLKLTAEQKIPTVATIRYMIRNVSWTPQYEWRAEPAESVVTLTYRASIFQNSGENWTAAQLTLYANPARQSGAIPQLYPLEIQQRQNRPTDRAYMMTESFAPSKLMATADIQNEITPSSTSFIFNIQNKATIPSSETTTSIPIRTLELPMNFVSKVIPAISTDAFLEGTTTYEQDIPLLAGRSSTFVDNVLTTQSYLEETLPGQELNLSFGRDTHISVKRKEGTQRDSRTGFIDKSKVLHRQFLTEIKNLHATPHSIVVVDQFPIAKDEKFKIERILPTNSSITRPDPEIDNGIFHQQLELAPGEERTLTTEYKITFPRDWNITPNI